MTRAALIDTFNHLIDAQSYASITSADIATQSGGTLNAIYNSYRDKSALPAAADGVAARDTVEAAHTARQFEEPALERLRKMGWMLREEWGVIIDDDGSGEVADIVGLRVIDGTLLIRLVHCKYAHGDKPGSRLSDLYEVAGQAQRSASWRRDPDAMFTRLIRRERTRAHAGRTGFVRGDIEQLHSMFEQSPNLATRLHIAIAQPGLSASRVSSGQLELLSSVDTYLVDTAMTQLEVICSA